MRGPSGPLSEGAAGLGWGAGVCAGRFRLWDGVLSLAWRGARGLFRGWKGGVFVWLALRVCGALTATVW